MLSDSFDSDARKRFGFKGNEKRRRRRCAVFNNPAEAVNRCFIDVDCTFLESESFFFLSQQISHRGLSEVLLYSEVLTSLSVM